MDASILAISTAVPPFAFSQLEVAEKFIEMLDVECDTAKKIRRLHHNSSIQTRYSVLPDFAKDCSEPFLWNSNSSKETPGMSKRNALYAFEAPKLAYHAASKALKLWGGEPSSITHVISVSCTGMVAPGIEFELIRLLNLNISVERLGINFMGCFGAFKGLAVAQSFAKENPDHRILVVCTESCSLHFQTDQTPDNILANSLFSDGAAAVIIGTNPKPYETSLWTIRNKGSLALENTTDKMRWEASDFGFVMKLSNTIPVLLARQIDAFVQYLLGKNFSLSNCDFAIHPGGKSIIQAIEKVLKLKPEQTKASWETLANYGNMSSASFLFVLKNLLTQKNLKPWTVGLGFGPGLSVEGILLSRPDII